MRKPVDAERLHDLMRRLGRAARDPGRIYLTGGATAVLYGWRPTTIDVDIRIVPEQDSILRAIPGAKEDLDINIEIASPPEFIPEIPGWEGRSLFIVREGSIAFHHFDFESQGLAKLERGHATDLDDVRAMLRTGLIIPNRLAEAFEQIEPELYRFPSIDPRAFRTRVEAMIREVAG